MPRGTGQSWRQGGVGLSLWAQLRPSAWEEVGLGKEAEEAEAPQIEPRHEPGLVWDEEPQCVYLGHQDGSKKKL